MEKQPFIHFDSIKVNAIDTNAGIFVGTNTQSFWTSNSSTKSGFGSVTGSENIVTRAVCIFKDDDVIDTPITSTSRSFSYKDG
jgi:hypothetical protein